MPFSNEVAESLVGKSRDDYKCNHVVNEVLTGTISGRKASDYLTWGRPVTIISPGTVVVGKDGKHVGIFVDHNNFIHSSSSAQKVIKLDQSQLHYVFPKGFEFRKLN